MGNAPKPLIVMKRTLRCAMPTIPNDDTKQFEADLDKHFPQWKLEIEVRNAKVYQVEVPVKMANDFATFVNSNFGKML